MSENSHSESYKQAGVDVTAGYRAVELMKKHVERTRVPGVIDGIGGFGGLFGLNLKGVKRPVLVSGTDGVGTKIKIAQAMDRHNTIGIDCVAMCVNDVVCAGAAPLFFLDYIAIGKNVPEKVEQIVAGVAEGCVQAGCALIGGETAEHPGVMPEEDYDLAGFTVGLVDEEDILSRDVREGDTLVSVASSGVHSNGFSLIRKVLGDDKKSLEAHSNELGMTVGDCLLTPTKIYVKPILRLLKGVAVRSISHITGGGFYENIPRALPDGCGAVIERAALDIPPIFQMIAKKGNIPDHDMFNTFNMGAGMVAVVAKDQAEEAVQILTACGEKAAVIGYASYKTEGIVIA
ncbi:MAG: phosphoribosylformylglycinamidine cyclo-ligase [Oscillospiraceae bacterium]